MVKKCYSHRVASNTQELVKTLVLRAGSGGEDRIRLCVVSTNQIAANVIFMLILDRYSEYQNNIFF